MRIQIVLFALVTIAVAFGTTVLHVMADTTGQSTGSFGMCNKAPVVGAITLYDATGETEVTSGEMTPQTYYNVSIVVSDDNKLKDLTEILVVIHNKTYTGANSVNDKVTYSWTPDGGWVEDLRPDNPNTWGTIVPAECIVPGDLTALSGTWNVKFMPGKVARELTNGWNITVTATDEAFASDDNTLADLTMLWYGEITVTSGSFSFGTLELGATDHRISNPASNRIQFKTKVNGNYKLQSKTVNWQNAGHSKTIILDTDGGTLAHGTFALKNYGSDMVGSANYVGTTESTIGGKSNVESNLSETGNNELIYAWISVASKGIMPYQYSGTYTVTIYNDA